MGSIRKLRQLVVNSEDLHPALTYFFYGLEESGQLAVAVEICDKAIKRYSELKALLKGIENTASDKWGKKIRVRDSLFYVVEQESFFYRYCYVSKMMSWLPLLYFGDVKMGMFAFPNRVGYAEFCRVSVSDVVSV